MARVLVTMLPVGQGAMNLIEIYDNNEILQNLSLVDCGIARTTPAKYRNLGTPVKECVDYVVKKMKIRHQAASDKVYLDYVLFTHRDSDHWTLFDALWEAMFGEDIVLSRAGLPVRYLHKRIDEKAAEELFWDQRDNYAEYRRTGTSPDRETCYWREFECKISFSENSPRLSIRYEGGDGRYMVKIGPSALGYNFQLHDNHTEKLVATMVLKLRYEEGVPMTTFDGFFRNRGRTWKSPIPYPGSATDIAKAWVEFGKYAASQERGMEVLAELEYHFGDYKYLEITRDGINSRLQGEGTVSGVIGQVITGGSIKADVSAKGGPSYVKKMLERAELLSRNGIVEAAPPQSYEMGKGSPFVLYILERLQLDTLSGIRVKGAEGASSSAIQKNGTSAVSSLENSEDAEFKKFIFTGDATIHTFFKMEESGVFEPRQDAVWTAPHHGSYPTIKGMKPAPDGGEEEKAKDIPAFPEMLKEFQPEVMIVSAGYPNSYGHPNNTFVNWAGEYLATRPGVESHWILYNLSDGKNFNRQDRQTDQLIFTMLEPSENGLVPQMFRFTVDNVSAEFYHERINILDVSPKSEQKNVATDVRARIKGDKSPVSVPQPGMFFRRHP